MSCCPHTFCQCAVDSMVVVCGICHSPVVFQPPGITHSSRSSAIDPCDHACEYSPGGGTNGTRVQCCSQCGMFVHEVCALESTKPQSEIMRTVASGRRLEPKPVAQAPSETAREVFGRFRSIVETRFAAMRLKRAVGDNGRANMWRADTVEDSESTISMADNAAENQFDSRSHPHGCGNGPESFGAPLARQLEALSTGQGGPNAQSQSDTHRHRMLEAPIFFPARCHADHSLERPESSFHAVPFLGLGAVGFHCMTCSVTLHRECLGFLGDPSTYDVVLRDSAGTGETDTASSPLMSSAPPRSLDWLSSLSFMRKTPWGGRRVRGASSSVDLGDAAASVTALGDSSTALSSQGESSPSFGVTSDAAVEWIARTVFGDTADPHLRLILGSTVRLLRRLQRRHPQLTWSKMNPLHLRSINQRHKELFRLVSESLPDATVDPDDLMEICEILRYATAVYGVAYREGYLQSMFSGLMMLGVRRDLLTPNPAESDTAVLEILGLPTVALRHSRWGSKVLEATYVLITDDERRRIVLSFRGTLSNEDVLTDCCAYTVPFCGGYAHEGFVRSVNQVLGQACDAPSEREISTECLKGLESVDASGSIAPPKGDLLAMLRQEMAKNPEYRVVVTGHSLGAALALLFGVRVIREKLLGEEVLRSSRFHVYAYGPPPVLSMPEADEYSEHITCIINGPDTITRLQLNSLDRLAHDLCIGSKTSGPSAQGGNFSRHDPYAAVDDGDLSDELFHPGRVLMMTTSSSSSAARLVTVPRGKLATHMIFFVKDMFSSHLVDSYFSALLSLRVGKSTG